MRLLPDEIFGALDLELYTNSDKENFAGLKVTISPDPPWNWFSEGGYEVLIPSETFSELLKTACRRHF